MISGQEISQNYLALAPRLGWTPRPTLAQFDAIARVVNELVTSEADEPAALFYAIGRYPRLFADAWVEFGRIATGAAAWRRGKQLVVSRELARRWLVEVAAQQATFAEIRDRIEALAVDVSPSRS